MDNNDRSTTRYDSYDFDHVVAELVANYGKGDPYWVSPGVHLILFANPHPRGVAEAEAKMTKNASKCALPADNQVFSDAELENAITALVDEYRRMPQDMYIVLKGPSGTGKTVLLGKITKLLSTLLPSNGSCAVEDNLKDVIEALGTFGNAATASNHNSSRFGIELELAMDVTGLCGVNVDIFGFVGARAALPPPGQGSFHAVEQAVSFLKEHCPFPSPSGQLATSASHYPPTFYLLQRMFQTTTATAQHIDTATRSDIVWKTLLAVAALRIACDEREAVTSQAVDYWLAVAGEKLGITAVLVKAAKYRFPDGSAGTRSLREIRSWAKDLCLDLYSVIFEVVVAGYSKDRLARSSADQSSRTVSNRIRVLDTPGLEDNAINGVDELAVNIGSDRMARCVLSNILEAAQTGPRRSETVTVRGRYDSLAEDAETLAASVVQSATKVNKLSKHTSFDRQVALFRKSLATDSRSRLDDQKKIVTLKHVGGTTSTTDHNDDGVRVAYVIENLVAQSVKGSVGLHALHKHSRVLQALSEMCSTLANVAWPKLGDPPRITLASAQAGTSRVIERLRQAQPRLVLIRTLNARQRYDNRENDEFAAKGLFKVAVRQQLLSSSVPRILELLSTMWHSVAPLKAFQSRYTTLIQTGFVIPRFADPQNASAEATLSGTATGECQLGLHSGHLIEYDEKVYMMVEAVNALEAALQTAVPPITSLESPLMALPSKVKVKQDSPARISPPSADVDHAPHATLSMVWEQLVETEHGADFLGDSKHALTTQSGDEQLVAPPRRDEMLPIRFPVSAPAIMSTNIPKDVTAPAASRVSADREACLSALLSPKQPTNDSTSGVYGSAGVWRINDLPSSIAEQLATAARSHALLPLATAKITSLRSERDALGAKLAASQVQLADLANVLADTVLGILLETANSDSSCSYGQAIAVICDSLVVTGQLTIEAIEERLFVALRLATASFYNIGCILRAFATLSAQQRVGPQTWRRATEDARTKVLQLFEGKLALCGGPAEVHNAYLTASSQLTLAFAGIPGLHEDRALVADLTDGLIHIAARHVGFPDGP